MLRPIVRMWEATNVVLFVVLVLFIVASAVSFLMNLLLDNIREKDHRSEPAEISANRYISSCGQCPVTPDAGATWISEPLPSADEALEWEPPEREGSE